MKISTLQFENAKADGFGRLQPREWLEMEGKPQKTELKVRRNPALIILFLDPVPNDLILLVVPGAAAA